MRAISLVCARRLNCTVASKMIFKTGNEKKIPLGQLDHRRAPGLSMVALTKALMGYDGAGGIDHDM